MAGECGTMPSTKVCTKRGNMTSIKIGQPSDLDIIIGLLHDYDFDIDQINDKSDIFELVTIIPGTAKIIGKFLIFKLFEIQERESILKICHVKSCKIIDTQKIGWYGFNTITFNPDTCSFTILAEPMATITIDVKSFDVSLQITDKIAGHKKRWGIFSPLNTVSND